MILNAVSVAAFFADTVSKAPVVIHCQQAASEPFWRTLLQIFQIVIPVAGGVLIAWMAFRWNSTKDHDRWILDQKKAEWRETLDAIKVCEDFLPLTGGNKEEILPEVRMEALEKIRRVQQLFFDRLFVDHSALGQVYSKWNDVNDMIGKTEAVGRLEYTSAYIGLVEFTRRAARRDLGVAD